MPRLAEAVARHPQHVNRRDKQNGMTPLHLAVMGNQANLAEYFLAHGADVNARDVKEQTPLHWALVAEQPDCADIIRIFGGTE